MAADRAESRMTKHQFVSASTGLNSPDTFECACGVKGSGMANWQHQFIEHAAKEAVTKCGSN